jgi:tetratricopeptide (TPR) repeat protein
MTIVIRCLGTKSVYTYASGDMFMFGSEKRATTIFALPFIVCALCFTSIVFAQEATDDAKIIERYKQMLNRKPKEGSTFDRLYQFYLEGSGLDAMVADYQAEAAAEPDNPNPQLILGHIYKRLGKDAEAVKAYQHAVELAPNNYYPHFALGQAYVILLQHENAIEALNQAAKIAEETQAATPEELTAIYKALGSAYFRRDRINEAIVAWTKIAELDPENIFSRIELADLLREQELYEQAITQHEAIIAFKADDPYRVCLSRREIGNIHEAKGDYEAAIESYDAALALTAPGNWLRKDLQHRIIGIYAADGNWEGLIEYYQKKLETTPNEPELLGLLAAAYIENQQLDEGIATYQKAVELAPTDANLRLNLIAAFRNAERFEDAAAAYESLSEQDPDDFGIYRELGELYLHLEDEDKARTTYQRMIDRDPENAGTHLILAEIYASNEWLEDAAAAYQKAVALAPSNLDYIEYFGEFYFRQGDREKALETWNMMVAADKGIPENYDQLAQLLDTKSFHPEAIDASRKAVELMPDVYRYREALAKRLMENGDYAAALTEYTEAAKLAPNAFFAEEMDNQRIELYRRQGTLGDKIDTVEEALETPGLSAADIFAKQKQLAKMYLKLGNITYALEVLLKAKVQHPDDIVINRWLAEVYVRQSRRDDANAIYRHLIEIDSANAREYYGNIARAYLKVMDFDAATTAAKQAIAHSPRNPEGHQMLAEIAKQSGNYDSAIDSLKQALRLRPEAIDTRADLAATFKLAGKPRQALAQYWRCWELSDTVSDKLAFVKPLSEAYYDLGRRGEFEEKLKQLSKSNTSSVGPVIALAELYRMEGDLPSARFQLARALDRERENPDLLTQLVNVSIDLGDTQDAISYQQRLVKAHPDPRHQQQLGKLLFEVGREQEAIQVWTKLLHAKNQTLEAEVKLATLLIRHGLMEEAISVLDRAAEKITGTDAAIALYQLGAVLVGMNESERAQPYFQRILALPQPRQPTQDTPGMNVNKFEISRSRVGDIQRKSAFMAGSMPWIPKTFAEAQASALVQLTTLAQQQGELPELIQQFEADVEANPTDIQALETLAQLYTLVQHSDKADPIIDRLIDASPNEPVYQRLLLERALQKNLNYETLKKALDAMPGLSHEARLRYVAEYAEKLYRERKRSDARKLMSELEDVQVTDLSTGITLVNAFVRMNKTEAAEKIIAQLPKPTLKQLSQYTQPYKRLTGDYIRDGHIDKAVAFLWTFCERTKPETTNPKRVATLSRTSRWYYSGHTPLLSTYPLPTVYYNQTRLEHLQWAFQELWLRNEQETLYTQLQTALNAAEGRDRIYPSLALSYCYWWDEKRAEAQNVLSELQKEFPNDFTLKLMTAFAAIQTGNHKTGLAMLGELAESDPRNRRQYSELRLELALHTGDTVTVRELVTKLLNSPTTAPALYHFSQKLRDAGLTQYAIAAAKRAMPLAMGQQSPNFLMELSGHLERLGRGQDAARVAERALHLANRPDRYGRTLYSWNLQRATHLTSHAKNMRSREPELIKATENNPNSFQAHVKLATFYENTNQIEKASAAFTAALTLRPNDNVTRQRYVQMLRRSGKASETVPHYTVLLRNNSNALGYSYREAIDAFFQADKVDELIALAKDLILPVGQYAGNDFTHKVAQRCLSHNRPEAAIEIFEKIIAVHPNWNYVYRELADAYAATGVHEKAIQFLKESQEAGKTGLSQTAFVLKLAEFHEASGGSEAATQFLREKLGGGDISNSEVAFVLKLAELYKASGTLAALITEYEARLAEKPEDAALLYLIANMKLETDDIEGANTYVNQLLDNALSSTRVQWLYSLAEAYKAAGEQDFQIQLLVSAVEKLKTENSWNLSEGYQKLGQAYANINEKEKAQDAFRQMGTIQLLRKDSRAYYDIRDLAGTYMQHEMWDEAEALFTEIINDLSTRPYDREQAQERLMQIEKQRSRLEATPQMTAKTQGMNVGVQRAFAREYMDRGETEKAIEIYEQIVQAMPEDLESRAQLATLYSQQNLHDKAIETWKVLLKTDSENTKYQDGLINSYQTSGKVGEALALAQQYIDADPDIGAHYARLAKLHKDENQTDAAITAYQKASELTPGNAKIYQELAGLYLRKDNLTSAEKAFKEAIRYTSQDWERQRLEQQLIGLYARQGKLEEMLQKAETEGTLTPAMQEERAKHYRENGELEKAVSAYKKALDMTPQGYDREDLASTLIRVYVESDKIDSAVGLYEAELLANSSSTRRSTTYSSSSGITTYYAGDEAREALIGAFKDQGKLETLKTVFESRREKEADNPNVLEMVADIYRNADDHEKAAEAYQTLSTVQSDPKNILSAYYAAVALHQNQQSELATAQLERAATLFSSSNSNRSESFLGTLATICWKGKMYAPAIKLANEAVTEAQSSSNTWELEYLYEILGECSLDAKQYAEAFNAYQQLANIARSHYKRENAETKMHQAATSGDLYEKWIPQRLEQVQENPGSLDARLDLAEAYEFSDKVDEAIAEYQKLSEHQPDNAQWHKKLGDLYLKQPPQQYETGEVVEGSALILDGNSSFVEIGNSNILNAITQQVTVSVWIKPTDFPNRYMPIIFKGDKRTSNFSHRSYILYLREDGKIQIASSPNGQGQRSFYTSADTIELNRWYHIAGVINAKRNAMQLFINGVEVGKTGFKGEESFYKSQNPLRIGWTYEKARPTQSPFIGLIDEVRIWNVARTGAEIRADMNTELTGNERGLVAYWKFDEETDGIVPDASLNKHEGRFIGNAKLEPYTRPIFNSTRPEQLEQAAAAYESALQLEPNSYELYRLLAETYMNSRNPSNVEDVYRRALEAPLTQREHEAAVKAILGLYIDDGQAEKHIALLEELKSKMERSAVLHELLGDAYTKTGDTEKAEIAYAEWAKIRNKEVNKSQRASDYHQFAVQLLNRNITPEIALELAKRATQNTNYWNYHLTLGRAHLANSEYDAAREQFKHSLNTLDPSNGSYLDFTRMLWTQLAQAGKSAKHEKAYVEMITQLINELPDTPAISARGNAVLAQFYLDHHQPDKAKAYIHKTTFIPETAWSVIGPFDNTNGAGYDKAFIPEEATQLDTTLIYDGHNGQIGWTQQTDETFDGYVDFETIFGGDLNWVAAYAWTTLTVPDERIAHIYFGSDDQAKIWLNGKSVLTDSTAHSVAIDHATIPVTLKPGKNTLLVKVCDEEIFWGFYLRITDTDGKPFDDLIINKSEEN